MFPDASDVDTDTKLLIISAPCFCSSPRISVGALSSHKEYAHVDFLDVEIQSSKTLNLPKGLNFFDCKIVIITLTNLLK